MGLEFRKWIEVRDLTSPEFANQLHFRWFRTTSKAVVVDWRGRDRQRSLGNDLMHGVRHSIPTWDVYNANVTLAILWAGHLGQRL